MTAVADVLEGHALACPPRWGTPRRLDRPTLGPRVAQIAQQLGKPLMPWQRYVIDVILEVDPATNLLAYRNVALTVPRQSGKTTLLLAAMVHRALGFGSRQGIVYTAQTRNSARKKWEDEHVRELEASSFNPLFKTKKSNGSEAIHWQNGSFHGITSTTEKAGHGDTLDLAVLDEAFAHEDSRLEQGLRPTMITRPQPQLWVVSTAGTRKSVYLRGKVDAGRARCEMGQTGSSAYFEWSAERDAPPGDEATWWACMPALGHTVTVEAIRAEFEDMDLAEFRRAYLNQWPDDAPDDWQVISKETWGALADPGSEALDPVCFAIDVPPERNAAAIAMAGVRPDGDRHMEVVDHKRGTGWVVGRARELQDRWKPCAWIIDAAGPAGSLIAPLEAASIEVHKPTAREAAHAAQSLFDGVTDAGDIHHLDDPRLNAALAGAAKRPLGDMWLWARKGLSVDISPLVSGTLALWGHSVHSSTAEPVEVASAKAPKPDAGDAREMWRPTSRLNI